MRHGGDEIGLHAVQFFELGDVLHEQEDAVPVSYTHLRAHETVLDLVCRLLLEKKKTITSK